MDQSRPDDGSCIGFQVPKRRTTLEPVRFDLRIHFDSSSSHPSGRQRTLHLKWNPTKMQRHLPYIGGFR